MWLLQMSHGDDDRREAAEGAPRASPACVPLSPEQQQQESETSSTAELKRVIEALQSIERGEPSSAVPHRLDCCPERLRFLLLLLAGHHQQQNAPQQPLREQEGQQHQQQQDDDEQQVPELESLEANCRAVVSFMGILGRVGDFKQWQQQ